MESLNKRIAGVLVKASESKKRKAQMEMEREKPKEDPKVKILDHLYEALSDEDSAAALDCLYKLTTNLGLADDVSYDVPEDHEEEDPGDHEFRDSPHKEHEPMDQEPESFIHDGAPEE